MKTIAIFILLTSSLIFTPHLWADPIIIAILEQPQCKQDSQMAVRVLFSKNDEEWLALYNASAAEKIDISHIIWTAVFDGHNVGKLKTFDPGFTTSYEWTYSRDRLIGISPNQQIPKMQNKGKEFEGWCSAPDYRPVVLVNQPNYKDPSGWKPFRPDGSFKKVLFTKFKAVAGAAESCLDEQENKTSPYTYTAKDLLIYRGYQNKAGQKLISIGLDSKHYHCDGPIEPAWTPHWFLINQDIYYIGNDMSVIDAGDYDNDGKSEMMFWHSGYNEDGYTLFYNDFRKRVDYYWKYH